MYNTESFNKCQTEVDTDFLPRKLQSLTLSELYDALGYGSRAGRVLNCGSFLEFHLTEEEVKLHKANFCKDRLCPTCNWRRSKKIFAQVSKVMDCLQADGLRFLFLTLTVKNCKFHELPETVNALLQAWGKLMKKSAFRKAVCGSFRVLEITVNKKNCTFHPHLHSILAVNPSYFTSREYISARKWSELWQASCDLEYTPIVYVEAVKSGKLDDVGANMELPQKTFYSAAKEVSHYIAKGSDYLNGEFEELLPRVSALAEALEGRRLATFSGVFKDAAAQLRLDDMENGDLVHTETEVREDLVQVIVRYVWRAGVYVKEVI